MEITTLVYPVKGEFLYLASKKKGFGAGLYNGYGGKWNEGSETIPQTAIREFHVESGAIAHPHDLRKVAVIDFFEEGNQLFECHVFILSHWDGEFKETDEMALPEEFHKSDLPLDQMFAADREFLPLLLSGKKIFGEAHYKQGMQELILFKHSPMPS